MGYMDRLEIIRNTVNPYSQAGALSFFVADVLKKGKIGKKVLLSMKEIFDQITIPDVKIAEYGLDDQYIKILEMMEDGDYLQVNTLDQLAGMKNPVAKRILIEKYGNPEITGTKPEKTVSATKKDEKTVPGTPQIKKIRKKVKPRVPSKDDFKKRLTDYTNFLKSGESEDKIREMERKYFPEVFDIIESVPKTVKKPAHLDYPEVIEETTPNYTEDPEFAKIEKEILQKGTNMAIKEMMSQITKLDEVDVFDARNEHQLDEIFKNEIY